MRTCPLLSISSFFPLAFPTIDNSDTCLDLGREGQFIFQMPFAPQDIKVLVQENWKDGENRLVMRLEATDADETFIQADWIDATVDFIKGLDDNPMNRYRRQVPDHIANWRKITSSKCDLCRRFLQFRKATINYVISEYGQDGHCSMSSWFISR